MGSKHHEQRQKQHGKGTAINPHKMPPALQEGDEPAADEEARRHARGEALDDDRMSEGTRARRSGAH